MDRKIDRVDHHISPSCVFQFKGVFSLLCSFMPADCSCHPAEVPCETDSAGHRPPSSPLASPASWGDVTPAATALASIWAQIHVQVCVPVTCQQSRASQSKDAHRQAFKIQRQTQTSAAELIPNPKMKVQSAHVTGEENTLLRKSLYCSCFQKLSKYHFLCVCNALSHTYRGIFKDFWGSDLCMWFSHKKWRLKGCLAERTTFFLPFMSKLDRQLSSFFSFNQQI